MKLSIFTILLLIFNAFHVVADAHTPDSFASKLVFAAKAQIGETTIYDPAYVGLSFPNGDIDRERGVCSDVVIRALRDAYGFDLQSKVNADMNAHFASYPKNWGLIRTDKNIDHRRVPNLRRYLTRLGAQQQISDDPNNFQAGDIVSWDLPGNLTHIGVISDQKTRASVPLVIHNIGQGTQEEDILFMFKITDHFRLTPQMMQ